jgi:hypothetical protein
VEGVPSRLFEFNPPKNRQPFGLRSALSAKKQPGLTGVEGFQFLGVERVCEPEERRNLLHARQAGLPKARSSPRTPYNHFIPRPFGPLGIFILAGFMTAFFKGATFGAGIGEGGMPPSWGRRWMMVIGGAFIALSAPPPIDRVN